MAGECSAASWRRSGKKLRTAAGVHGNQTTSTQILEAGGSISRNSEEEGTTGCPQLT